MLKINKIRINKQNKLGFAVVMRIVAVGWVLPPDSEYRSTIPLSTTVVPDIYL